MVSPLAASASVSSVDAVLRGGTVGLAVARNGEFVPVQLVEQIDDGGAVGFCVGANGEGHG